MTLSLAPDPSASWGNSRRRGERPAASRVSLVIRRRQGTVEITVSGVLDTLGCELLAGALRDLVDGQGNLDVIVDVTDLDRIDGPALEAIAACAHTSALRAGRLRVRAATDGDAVVAALAEAGLDGLVMARRRPLSAIGILTGAKEASCPDPGDQALRVGVGARTPGPR